MTLGLVPFSGDLVSQAGALLAARHARDRVAIPALPPRFEDEAVAARAVEAVLSRPGASGFAALQDGILLAYLVGDWSTQSWGRCGHIYLPGHAAAEGRDSLLQDLYARLGEEWNRRGCFQHHVDNSAADGKVIDAFFSLGFGRERADALLDLRPLTVPEQKPRGDLLIRRATAGDGPRLAGLSSLIVRHQAMAPRWHPLPPEDLPDLAEGWAEIAGDPAWTIWLAVSGDETYGCAGFRPLAEADGEMARPARATDLSIAAVTEPMRGRGVASALAWHGLSHARGEGFAFCAADWQTANLMAARTWPRFGFEVVSYRLARSVNPMSAWARE